LTSNPQGGGSERGWTIGFYDVAITPFCSQARGAWKTLECVTAAFRGLDLRVKIAMVATSLANFGTRLTAQYDANYAVALDAPLVAIGVLSSLGSFFSALTAVPLGWATETSSVKRVMLLNIVLVLLPVLLPLRLDLAVVYPLLTSVPDIVRPYR